MTETTSTEVHIYVDGSFIDNHVGYGLVILPTNSDKSAVPLIELCGLVSDPDVQSMRQVAGELIAVQTALAWCIQQNIAAAHIFYDYNGIEAWATSRWKANLPATQQYARYVKRCGVRITWHKIASHTGNHWNERADVLAKQGAHSGGASVETKDHVTVLADDTASLIADLASTANAFAAYLTDHGIHAEFTRLYNDQFARIVIMPAGVFDLYNTKRKPLSPYLHDFKAKARETEVERAWQTFKASLPK